MPATAITETVSLMEVFFAAFCNADSGTQIPDCRGCEHNEFKHGCTHPENPANKMLQAIELPCTCRAWHPANPCPRHTALAALQKQRDAERARDYTPENDLIRTGDLA